MAVKYMKIIEGETFDEERALYGSDGVLVKGCRFDGPADGESAFKESRCVFADRSYFNLRYPFWHDDTVRITDSEMTPLCRAALWYSENIEIVRSKLHGIKALRECKGVRMHECDVISTEFGWYSSDITVENTSFEGEYFMMRSKGLRFSESSLNGKYSFQYIEDATFENCSFDTKDAFWHAKRVTVKNSVIKGEYLGWYCEDVTFENCKIIGTQPLCYCKGLKMINCEMHGADLAFEKSEVEADITTPVISIKNPAKGYIRVPHVDEIIMTEDEAKCEIIAE